MVVDFQSSALNLTKVLQKCEMVLKNNEVLWAPAIFPAAGRLHYTCWNHLQSDLPLHIWTKAKAPKNLLTDVYNLNLLQQLSLALSNRSEKWLILRGISTKTNLHKMGRLNSVDICQGTEKPACKTPFPMPVINLKTLFLVFLVLGLCDMSFSHRTLRKKNP